MTKETFLKQLDASLNRLPFEERQDILQDFEEHFSNAFADGKTEEEIIAALGSPQQIAKELLASYHLEKVENNMTTANIIRAVWAVIGLGFFNLVFVAGPFFGLMGILFAGWAVSTGFIVSPILMLFNTFIFPDTFTWFDLFFSILLCGIGLFIAIGMFFVTKTVFHLFIRYLKFNASIVKGGLKND